MHKPQLIYSASRHDTTGLNGCWVATGACLAGVPLPPEALSELTLRVFKRSLVFGNDVGTLTIDRDTHPAAMDVVITRGPNAGRFVPAILEYTSGTLRICCDLSGRRRPTQFHARAGTSELLATYRRSLTVVH